MQTTMPCPTCQTEIDLPPHRPMAHLCQTCCSLIFFEDPVSKKHLSPPRVATKLDWLALSDLFPRIHAHLAAEVAEGAIRLWRERSRPLS